jgi:hypothetical protein
MKTYSTAPETSPSLPNPIGVEKVGHSVSPMMLPESDERRQRSRPLLRLGTGPGEAIVDETFGVGGPVFVEARLLDESDSPYFYLLHLPSEFREVASQFRGQNAEFHLTRADTVPNTAPLVAYWANGSQEQMRSGLRRFVGKLLLVRCSHTGSADYYTLLASEEDTAEFLSHPWAGWRVAAYDAWEASRRVHSVTLFPQSP